jgi:hypothetical protein
MDYEIYDKINLLEKRAEAIFSHLKNSAKAQNKNISLKKQKGCICIKSYLKKLEILQSAAESIHTEIFNIDEYKNHIATNLFELTRNIGGLEKSIQQLRYFLQAPKESEELHLYIGEIRQALILASNCITQENTQINLPYCALCWRKPVDSPNYCAFHNSTNPRTRANYVRDRRLFINAIKKTDDFVKIIKFDGKGMNGNKVSPFVIFSLYSNLIRKESLNLYDVTFFESPNITWERKYMRLTFLVKDSFPYTYDLVKKVNIIRCENLSEWLNQVLKVLDYDSKIYNMNSWLKFDNTSNNWETVLKIFHRHEIYKIFTTTSKPRGPQKGQVKKNYDLRSAVNELAQEQLKTRSKVNASKIARQLRRSRQRISVLLNEF